MKTLDSKLSKIRSGKYSCKDFIIADAKDGDMGFGRTAPGPHRTENRLKTKAEYLASMVEMTKSGLVDIMLMSASCAEALGLKTFAKSKATPAVRLNDTTDIWSQRGGTYKDTPSHPYRSARIAQARKLSDLGLYSVTYSNDVNHDLRSLEAYAAFREEAHKAKFRHFLEVFNPAMDIGLKGAKLAEFINDCIVRTLAGVMSAEYPLFLKMPYNGAAAMEELSSYDPTKLIVGILGGGKGTTRDTFELAAQAEKHGARVALFGRKINFAEAPVELVRLMRASVEGQLSCADAVKAYHDYLAKHNIKADRSVAEDSEITDPVLKV
jgi:DhnA family fructose-bisphosphate aldolase class Ia